MSDDKLKQFLAALDDKDTNSPNNNNNNSNNNSNNTNSNTTSSNTNSAQQKAAELLTSLLLGGSGSKADGERTPNKGPCNCGYKHWLKAKEFDFVFLLNTGANGKQYVGYNLTDNPFQIAENFIIEHNINRNSLNDTHLISALANAIIDHTTQNTQPTPISAPLDPYNTPTTTTSNSNFDATKASKFAAKGHAHFNTVTQQWEGTVGASTGERHEIMSAEEKKKKQLTEEAKKKLDEQKLKQQLEKDRIKEQMRLDRMERESRKRAEAELAKQPQVTIEQGIVRPRMVEQREREKEANEMETDPFSFDNEIQENRYNKDSDSDQDDDFEDAKTFHRDNNTNNNNSSSLRKREKYDRLDSDEDFFTKPTKHGNNGNRFSNNQQSKSPFKPSQTSQQDRKMMTMSQMNSSSNNNNNNSMFGAKDASADFSSLRESKDSDDSKAELSFELYRALYKQLGEERFEEMLQKNNVPQSEISMMSKMMKIMEMTNTPSSFNKKSNSQNQHNNNNNNKSNGMFGGGHTLGSASNNNNNNNGFSQITRTSSSNSNSSSENYNFGGGNLLGSGQSLNNNNNNHENNNNSHSFSIENQSTQTQTTPNDETEKFQVNSSEPTTSIQIRLHNGEKIVQSFNHSHCVRHIRLIIDTRFPGVRYQLMTTFPKKVLSDSNQSISQAGLLNAVIVMSLL